MKPTPILAALLALAGCMDSPAPAPGPLADPPVEAAAGEARCLSRVTTPAVLETVTEQIVVQPAVLASDGSVLSPAMFRTVTRQRIVRERREVEFETPCAAVMTPEFVASVQRALQARGYLHGAITGGLDDRTGRAIQRFQRDRGDVDTTTLTMRTALDLGLVAVPRDPADG